MNSVIRQMVDPQAGNGFLCVREEDGTQKYYCSYKKGEHVSVYVFTKKTANDILKIIARQITHGGYMTWYDGAMISASMLNGMKATDKLREIIDGTNHSMDGSPRHERGFGD